MPRKPPRRTAAKKPRGGAYSAAKADADAEAFGKRIAEALGYVLSGAHAEAEFEKAAATRAPGAARVSPMQTVGSIGTPVWGGYVQDRETNADLVGPAKWKTYSNLTLNLPIVGASLRMVLGLTATSEWLFPPPPKNRTSETEQIAELVEDVLDDMETPWPHAVNALALYRSDGNSVNEWTAKRRPDGVLGFADLARRAPHTITRWDVDEAGKVRGVWQQSTVTYQEVYLPRWKLVYAVDNQLSSSPEGVGILRQCVAAAQRELRYEQLEGWGYETNLQGVPVVYAPLAAIKAAPKSVMTDAEKAAAIAEFEKIAKNHIRGPQTGYVLDSQTYLDAHKAPSSVAMQRIELLRGDASAFGPLADSIERVEHRIAALFGTQFLLTGAKGEGSRALSAEQLRFVVMLVNGILRDLSYVVRKDLVEPWGMLNGIDAELLPWPTPRKVTVRDAAKLAQTLVDLGAALPVLGPEVINAVLVDEGLPEVDEDRLDEMDAALRRGAAAGDDPPKGDPDDDDQVDDATEAERTRVRREED